MKETVVKSLRKQQAAGAVAWGAYMDPQADGGHRTSDPSEGRSSELCLLLCNADGFAVTSSGLGVLPPDLEAPVVPQPSMQTHLLQSFKIFTPH